MTDLHRVLTEATEHVGSPDLAGRALAAAHRTRVRRASAGALAAVVLVGGGVAWAVQDRAPHADVVDTPVPSPAPVPSTHVTRDDDPATQGTWDPFFLADIAFTDSVLPERLEPPSDPPDLADAPLPDVVVAWPEDGADLRVLGSNGEWRSVAGTATAVQGTLVDVVSPSISPDGGRVAMATNQGILVVDVTSGEQQVVPWPRELEGPWDVRPDVRWRPGDEGFVVMHWKEPWLVRPDGTGEPVTGTAEFSRLMVDPDDGTLRDRDWKRGTLRTWNSWDDISSVSLRGFGDRYVTRFDKVAYMGSPGQFDMGVMKAGPIVVEAETGEIVGYAPVEDPDSAYSNGNITPVGFLDPVTVLLLVTPLDLRTMDGGDATTYLVAWKWDVGGFDVLTAGSSTMREIAVAPDLVLGG